jgi:inorganic pyrophosphatase
MRYNSPLKGLFTMLAKKPCLLITVSLVCVFVLAGCTTTPPGEAVGQGTNLTLVDQYTLAGEKHLLRGYQPIDTSGNINVVVEIPAGTSAKWEVDKNTGQLKWKLKQGEPRVVSYLGYPGNYGMIPRTLLPEELGGDGDPLDVIIVGPAVPRGSVMWARPVGVLKMLDDGEQDDKIIAVPLDSHLGGISSIEELKREYPGIAEILEIWFSNYKGPGKIESLGFGSVAEARNTIDAAIAAYKRELTAKK